MATFVLVHGAWIGGCYWRKVSPLLRDAGHDVFTPTLTGIGERSHLLTPAVDLDLHIQDVANVLDYEDLRHMVLVGASYGGLVITGVAERVAERLAHLVYVDAYVPFDGESWFDLMGSERSAAVRERAASVGDGWRVPCVPLDRFGLSDADLTWADARTGPQPLKTFEQPIRLSNPAAQALPRTYIRCTESPGLSAQAERIRTTPGWRYCEIATSHLPMMTEPVKLTALLLEVAELARAVT